MKFRQACSYAIDRESIIKSIYSGHAIPEYGYETSGNKKWNNPNVVAQYPHDLAKAHALLKEIGIEDHKGDGALEDADGNRIEFVLNTMTHNTAFEKTAVLIASDLEKIGFKVIVQSLELNTLLNKTEDTYNYDCVLLGLISGSADPSDGMNVIKSDGFTHQWFPREKTPSTDWEARLDYLMDAQMKTLDYAERKKDYDEVQEILAEQVPFIYTITRFNYAAIHSDIGNNRPTSFSFYRVTWNAEELYFKSK